uniref:Uncharacterized protein n=1 Tax=Pyxicephalus adspersus TaxID=30357 RepID=A0AAV3ARA2_PYXAD|nr:TPA: hypothetical protein GDO54_009330 [Pyxicephalus adspersus]
MQNLNIPVETFTYQELTNLHPLMYGDCFQSLHICKLHIFCAYWLHHWKCIELQHKAIPHSELFFYPRFFRPPPVNNGKWQPL